MGEALEGRMSRAFMLGMLFGASLRFVRAWVDHLVAGTGLPRIESLPTFMEVVVQAVGLGLGWGIAFCVLLYVARLLGRHLSRRPRRG